MLFNLLIGMNFIPLQIGKALPGKKKKEEETILLSLLLPSAVSPADSKGNQGDGNPHT